MTQRDTPESWSRTRATEKDKMTRLSQKQETPESQKSGIVATGSTSESVKRRTQSNSEDSPLNKSTEISPTKKSQKLPRWTKSWVLWTVLLALVPGGIAFVSMAMLLKLPTAPNCPSIFWPLASASVRLHCAQLAASKQTVNDLLQAIALVNQLPKSHPLRGEIDRNLEEWSREILQLADESFQTGNIEQAIATARKIPEDASAYKLVEEKIGSWQSIWSKAEDIYKQAEAEARERHWYQAFMAASKLLRVDNKYWASSKYEQLNGLINRAREDGDKLAKAESLSKYAGVDSLLKAIKLAETIAPDSYIYQKAQEAIPEFGRKILELAEAKLNARDADAAIAIAQKIPASTKLGLDTQDFIALAEAQKSGWTGTVSGLQDAITQAQQITPTRPLYDKAQKLIARWQLEVQDVARLEKARTLASQGTVSDLTAAIAEAQLVPVDNPRGREARREIGQWRGQIETIEDRPYLERAEQIALLEDTNSLQAAIGEASQVRRGRALYPEARRRIATWTAKIQQIQDQPYLDRAEELARSGDLPAAIATAQQIATGRALSGKAQAAIDEWQGEIAATENWQKAREVALGGTPEALAEAMRLARQVPRNSNLSNNVSMAVDQWSQQLLDIARSQGDSDITRGIETARLIPRGTAAYDAAREQIRTWEEFLRPQPQEEIPQEQQASPEPQALPEESTTGEQ